MKMTYELHVANVLLVRERLLSLKSKTNVAWGKSL
jgi:hypothetical protein